MSELHKPSIAILASGSGSTAETFIRATQDDRVEAEVGLVISDKKNAGVFERVKRLEREYGLDIQTASITRTDYPGGAEGRGITKEQSEAMAELITGESIGHVSMMGFMQVVRFALLEQFAWRAGEPIYEGYLDNTHPAILPQTADTYGVHASQRVLDLGLPFSAHTYHLVSEEVDGGPILCATPVPVMPGDTSQTLFERVQLIEKAVLPIAIDRFLKEQAAYYADS